MLPNIPHKNSMMLYGIVLVVIVTALIVGSFWFTKERSEKSDSTVPETVSEEVGFGSEVGRRAGEPAQKAAEGVPDTNPLGGVEANPYSNYKNPFSR